MKIYSANERPSVVRISVSTGRGQGKAVLQFTDTSPEEVASLLCEAVEKHLGEKIMRPAWLLESKPKGSRKSGK